MKNENKCILFKNWIYIKFYWHHILFFSSFDLENAVLIRPGQHSIPLSSRSRPPVNCTPARTHAHTHTHTHTHTQAPTHTRTHVPTRPCTHAHTHTCTHAHTHTRTHTHMHPRTHSPSHPRMEPMCLGSIHFHRQQFNGVIALEVIIASVWIGRYIHQRFLVFAATRETTRFRAAKGSRGEADADSVFNSLAPDQELNCGLYYKPKVN